MPRAVLLTLLALLVLAPAAAATGMGAYARDPVEHDDQGQSLEPDFAATGVLGVSAENRVIDTNLDGVAAPDTALGVFTGTLAPGCTDDAGRQPSGLCALWSAGAGTWLGINYRALREGLVGIQGMSGNAAPGAFTAQKGAQVRFLDARLTPVLWTAGPTQVDLNRKLTDVGIRDQLAGADPALGAEFAGGPVAAWAWHGRWQDKNGNGVIDHYAHFSEHEEEDPDAQVRPDEEWAWAGNCFDFDGGFRPGSVAKGYCFLDAEATAGGTTRMLGWLWPGNHHASCGGWLDPLQLSCPHIPADVPGRQAIMLAAGLGAPICTGLVGVTCGGLPGAPVCAGVVGLACSANPRDLDATDLAVGGDPLLGPQDSVAPDQEYRDWTGDHSLLQRHWALGQAMPLYLYDQGLLARLVHVTGVGCPEDAQAPQRFRLDQCRFLDVDHYGGASPLVQDLLDTTVRPTARGAWLTARGDLLAVGGGLEALARPMALDLSPTTGPLDDRLLDPGLAREPNDPADTFPGALRGEGPDPFAQHRGWYNDYATHREAPRAYGDLWPERAVVVNRPVGVFGACALCSAGLVASSPYRGEAPGGLLRAEGDLRPTLGPGQYVFAGQFGRWHDKPQAWTEAFLDAACPGTPTNDLGTCGGASGLVRSRSYAAAPDGWVANVVNATQTWGYRGFGPETCTTEDGPGERTYAACHPYLDGSLANPQGYAPGVAAHAEWRGGCDAVEGRATLVRPLDGVWSVPVFVWRHHLDGVDPADFHGLQDWTGTSQALRLETLCGTGAFAGPVHVLDLLVLPLGNQAEPVETRIEVRLGQERVVDVDTYAGWM